MRFFNPFTSARTEIVNKKLADVRLSGRSMVEMLGVLAIIGVLSVGAISSYSKAMMKYKLNKQTEQISTILYNSLTSAEQFSPPAPNPGTSSVEYLTSVYIKLGYIPDEMIKGNYVYDIFNNPIDVAYANWETRQYMELHIFISNSDIDQCINLLSLIKEWRANIFSFFIHRSYEESGNNDFISFMAGDIRCARKNNTYPCLKDLTIAEMHDLCNVCAETKTCRLTVQYNYTD